MELDREVAVRMPHDPDRVEALRTEPGLLAQLAPRRLELRLAGLDLSPGELPEAPEQPGRGTTLDQPPTARIGEDHHGRTKVGAGRAAGPPRELARIHESSMRPAATDHGAEPALGTQRKADRLAELHDRLVERPGRAVAEEAREHPFETGPHPGRSDVP